MYKRLIRLGRYVSTPNQSACYYTAKYLSQEINKMGPFEVLFDGDRSKGIPAMSWTIKDEYKDKVNFTLYDFADRLRVRGWQVPAYPLPADRDDLVIQRDRKSVV